MKRKNPFEFRDWSKREAGPTPVAVIRTYVDDQGRTVRVMEPRHAETDEGRYTAKPKGRPKRD